MSTRRKRTASTVDPLGDFLSVQLTRANHLLTGEITRVFKKRGISMASSRVLAVLSVRDGQRVGELAQECLLQQSSVTKAIEQLETESLVTRRRDSKDRRHVDVNITAAGRRLTQEIFAVVRKLEDEDLAAWSAAERRQLRQMLAGLIERLRSRQP